jgi:glycosyltransferase involved in cell wall biosynthesis
VLQIGYSIYGCASVTIGGVCSFGTLQGHSIAYKSLMKISFVLPTHAVNPVGGFKVVNEYANGLAARGHEVTIILTAYGQRGDPSFSKAAKRVAIFIGRQVGLKGGYRPDAWFKVDSRVRIKWVPNLHARWVSDADVVVATAWQTAEWVREYSRRKGSKFYLIQDFEHYMSADRSTKTRIASTFSNNMCNIAISPAVIEMLEECNAPVDSYIPNGLDFSVYGLKVDPNRRSRSCIGFPWRPELYKGTADAVAAFRIVRARSNSDLDLWTFGWGRLDSPPKWINYYERPSDEMLSALYNRSSMFVTPSHYEGWGLPGSEAMACGAALVSTDSIGVRAYADHEKTALLSSPKDPAGLADNILRLMQDNDFRIRLAVQGCKYVQQFTWERAVGALEQLFVRTLQKDQ